MTIAKNGDRNKIAEVLSKFCNIEQLAILVIHRDCPIEIKEELEEKLQQVGRKYGQKMLLGGFAHQRSAEGFYSYPNMSCQAFLDSPN